MTEPPQGDGQAAGAPQAPMTLNADELRARVLLGGRFPVAVRGRSMQPTLQSGDVILVEPATKLRRGQIVTFAAGDSGVVVTHRVLAVSDGMVTCRGDNRRRRDRPVPVVAVIGRACETMDGRTLPAIDPSWLLAGLLARRVAARGRRWSSELALLARQLSEGRGGRSPRYEEVEHGVGADASRPGAVAIGPGTEVGDLVSKHPEADAAVVPAGVYCRGPRERRLALLQSLLGRDVTVYAYPSEVGGRRLPATALLRRGLGMLGINAGVPGDLTLPLSGEEHGEPERRPYAHAFADRELASELRLAGASRVRVERERVGRLSLLRARAHLGSCDEDSSDGHGEAP